MLVVFSKTQNLNYLPGGTRYELSAACVNSHFEPRDRSLLAQPISTQKAQSEKKAHKPLHTSWISQTNVSATCDDHTNLVILTLEQTISLRNLRFMLWPRELPRTTCAKDHGHLSHLLPTNPRSQKLLSKDKLSVFRVRLRFSLLGFVLVVYSAGQTYRWLIFLVVLLLFTTLHLVNFSYQLQW